MQKLSTEIRHNSFAGILLLIASDLLRCRQPKLLQQLVARLALSEIFEVVGSLKLSTWNGHAGH